MLLVRKVYGTVKTLFKRKPPVASEAEATLSLTPTTFWQTSPGYNINFGGKRIGRVHYWREAKERALPEEFPADWFVEGAKQDKKGRLQLKPFLWISELLMKDRMKVDALVPRDKKFGAMTMKELLKIAREMGCEDRIALEAAHCRGANFTPGRFYNKMGFSLTPERQKQLEALETKYNRSYEQLIQKGLSEDEAIAYLANFGLHKPVRINGRFVTETGRYNLTNPECILDYKV